MARNRQEVMANFNKYAEETRQRIEQGIEQNRKGQVTVLLKDQNGKPVQNAKIRFNQKTHEFLFGANIFMLDEFESEQKNIAYRKAYKDLFNQATLPFYWKDLEPTEGKPRFTKDSERIYRRPVPDLCLEYCAEHGITPKEHCLTYFQHHPDWVSKTDINDMKVKLEKRYKEISERYADKIHCWEVMNELLCAQVTENIANAFYKADDVLEWNFGLAEKYFPNNELVLNEGPLVWYWRHFAYNRSGFYMLVDRALKNGARIDAIGFQFHVFEKTNEEVMYNPHHLFQVLDTYSALNLPIQITEITVPAYSNDPEDEELQADILENLYSVWFSHKSVEMITYWNLVDGYAWSPDGTYGDMTKGENKYYAGLLDFNMRKKPAFHRIYDLFNKKWHTEGEAVSDAQGKIAFNGFFGTYEMEVNGKIYTIDHSKQKDSIVEITSDQ